MSSFHERVILNLFDDIRLWIVSWPFEVTSHDQRLCDLNGARTGLGGQVGAKMVYHRIGDASSLAGHVEELLRQHQLIEASYWCTSPR